MGRAVGFFMILLGLLGLGATLIDRPVIEGVWASWTDVLDAATENPAATAKNEIDPANDPVELESAPSKPAGQPVDPEGSATQDQSAAVTELQPGNVEVFERDQEISQELLPWVDVSPGSDSVSEDSDHVNFVLTLSEPVERPIIIIFSTVDGSARSDEDYVGQRGTVTFKPGTVSAEIRTPLVDDDVKEDDEQFALVLNGAPGTVNLQNRRVLTIIKDND